MRALFIHFSQPVKSSEIARDITNIMKQADVSMENKLRMMILYIVTQAGLKYARFFVFLHVSFFILSLPFLLFSGRRTSIRFRRQPALVPQKAKLLKA